MHSLLDQLRNDLSFQRLAPIVLLTGSQDLEDVAKNLARELLHGLDNHPDFHEYRPQGKADLHPIESIHHFTQEMYKPPYQSRHKFFLFHEAHKMSPFSANALLKTLEEPASDAYVFLVAPHKSLLLPTIVSRASLYQFQNNHRPLAENKTDPIYSLIVDIVENSKEKYWLDLLPEIDTHAQEIPLEEKKVILSWMVDKIQKGSSSLYLLRKMEEGVEKAIKQIERGGKLSTAIEYLYLLLDASLTEVPNQPSLERKVAK